MILVTTHFTPYSGFTPGTPVFTTIPLPGRGIPLPPNNGDSGIKWHGGLWLAESLIWQLQNKMQTTNFDMIKSHLSKNIMWILFLKCKSHLQWDKIFKKKSNRDGYLKKYCDTVKIETWNPTKQDYQIDIQKNFLNFNFWSQKRPISLFTKIYR